MRRCISISLIFLALSAGCGDQTTPDYEGEPLMTLRGVLVSEYPQPLPASDIVVSWPDWSKAETDGAGVTSTGFSTFVRLPVDATLPARFSATIFTPPPETAYTPPRTEFPRLIGPRFTMATFLLARAGKEIKNEGVPALDIAIADPNQTVLAFFDEYVLTYVESDGVLQAQLEDGSIVGAQPLKKGFSLSRQERTVCALSYDQACIDQNISVFGIPEESAWQGCVTSTEMVKGVELPPDSEITLTLKDPQAPRTKPPLCETPPAG
jgi:hypothetical protein